MTKPLWPIIEASVTVLDCSLITYFLDTYLHFKKRTKLSYFLSVISLFVICSLANRYCNLVQMLVVLSTALFIDAVIFCDGTVLTKLFWSLFCQIIFFGIDITENAVVGAILGDVTPSDFASAGELRLFNMIFSRFLVVLTIYALCRKRFFPEDLTPQQVVMLCLCPVLSCIAVLISLQLFYINGVDGRFIVLNCLMVCAVNLIVFFLFRSLSQQHMKLRIKEAEEEKARLENMQYKALQESNNRLQGWRHDMSNQLAAIAYFAKKEGADRVVEFVSSLKGEILKDSFVLDTDSNVINVILNAKISKALSEGIEVGLDLDVPVFSGISDPELCSLIGNILDNAIEANLELPRDKRCVYLTISHRGFLGFIKCTNPTAKDVADLQTTKSGEGHGIGIKRCCQIAEKHGGFCNFSSSDHIFTAQVMLPKEADPTMPRLLWGSGAATNKNA